MSQTPPAQAQQAQEAASYCQGGAIVLGDFAAKADSAYPTISASCATIAALLQLEALRLQAIAADPPSGEYQSAPRLTLTPLEVDHLVDADGIGDTGARTTLALHDAALFLDASLHAYERAQGATFGLGPPSEDRALHAARRLTETRVYANAGGAALRSAGDHLLAMGERMPDEITEDRQAMLAREISADVLLNVYRTGLPHQVVDAWHRRYTQRPEFSNEPSVDIRGVSERLRAAGRAFETWIPRLSDSTERRA